MFAARYNTNEKVIQYFCNTFKDTIDINMVVDVNKNQ